MKILKVHICNFQKHANLKLDFNSNINVITGLTDCGKSGIFRALEWVCNFSNISESDYRKEGTKETSVKIWLDNSFQIERVRSNTINRYILSQDDSEDKIFDNFGRNTPEEIAEVLGISTIDIENEHINLNFANQDQLNFLLDSTYSDTFKAKLFNKLTGNEVLDVLFKELNKESLRFNREIKETEENLKRQEEQLSEYSLSYKSLKKKLCMVTEQYEKVKEEIEIYEHLKDLSDKLKVNQEQENEVKDKVSQIKIVSDKKLKDLKKQAEDLKVIQELSYELEAINDNLKSLSNKKKEIKIVNVDFNKLKDTVNCIESYKNMYDNLQDNNEKIKTVLSNKTTVLQNRTKLEKELNEIWKEQKICPLCKKKI